MSSELNVLSRRLDAFPSSTAARETLPWRACATRCAKSIACFPVYRSLHPHPILSTPTNRTNATFGAPSKPRSAAIPQPADPFRFHPGPATASRPGQYRRSRPCRAAPLRHAFLFSPNRLTGPVMAKGPEDTAFYRYCPLLFAQRGRRLSLRHSASHSHTSTRKNAGPPHFVAKCHAGQFHPRYETKRGCSCANQRAVRNPLRMVPGNPRLERLNQDRKFSWLANLSPVQTRSTSVSNPHRRLAADAMKQRRAQGDSWAESTPTWKKPCARRKSIPVGSPQYGVRSRLSHLSKHPAGPRGQQAIPRRLSRRSRLGSPLRESSNSRSQTCSRSHPRVCLILSGNRSVELQPRRPRQSPVGEL